MKNPFKSNDEQKIDIEDTENLETEVKADEEKIATENAEAEQNAENNKATEEDVNPLSKLSRTSIIFCKVFSAPYFKRASFSCS